MDHSLPGSSIHGIFQARILEWVAISFSRDLPKPGTEPVSLRLLHWQADPLPLCHLGNWMWQEIVHWSLDLPHPQDDFSFFVVKPAELFPASGSLHLMFPTQNDFLLINPISAQLSSLHKGLLWQRAVLMCLITFYPLPCLFFMVLYEIIQFFIIYLSK